MLQAISSLGLTNEGASSMRGGAMFKRSGGLLSVVATGAAIVVGTAVIGIPSANAEARGRIVPKSETVAVKDHGGLRGTPVVAVSRKAPAACRKQNASCPRVTVGAGWSLYLYLNRGDVNWLAGLGYGVVTGALCAWGAT